MDSPTVADFQLQKLTGIFRLETVKSIWKQFFTGKGGCC
jgi:hypothetical protein